MAELDNSCRARVGQASCCEPAEKDSCREG